LAIPRTILSPFEKKFHKEAAIIGRLLAGYTNLEVGLMHCVQVVREDFDTVLKTMFRTRGETQRIDIADALGRHYYHSYRLGTQFEMAVGSMRYCLRVRNQYAHCVWWDDHSGKLAFANLEEIAAGHDYQTDLKSLTAFHVEVPLLKSQEAYFVYVDELLAWVNYEGRKRAGKISVQPLTRPNQRKQPNLHTP
jgi:hypothetical protein